MVSPLANVSFGAETFLSAPTADPSVAEETETPAGAGAGAGAVLGAGAGAGAGGGSFLHATRPTATRARARKRMVLFMVRLRGSLRGDLELLARVDLVGILEDVLVGLEDPVPGVGIAVLALGDLRERVSGLHLVDLGRGGAAAALHVGEIGGGGVRAGAAAALHIGEIGGVTTHQGLPWVELAWGCPL